MTRKRQSLSEYQNQEEAKPRRKQSDAVKAQEAAKTQSNIYGSLFVLGIIIVAALAIFFYLNRPAAASPLSTNLDLNAIPDNSVAYENLGQRHLNPNEAGGPYNSNPPTSGPHNPQWVTPLQVYTQQPPDEMLIHNLEHGHIWISYRDANDTDAITLLTTIQRKYPDRVIVTYRPEDTTRIAVAAWTRLLNLDSLDSDQIEAFIARYSDKAPESFLGR